MILRAHQAPQSIETGIAIVGAGAAGLTIAGELARAGRDFVLIESGGFEIDPDFSARHAPRVIGEAMVPTDLAMRVFGGATVGWSGRCVALDPEDHASRPWIAPSGWPVSHAELAPFVRRAATLIGFGATGLDARSDRAVAAVNWFDGDSRLAAQLWHFAPTGRGRFAHFGEIHWSQLDASRCARVLIEADGVVPIAGPGAVAGVRVRDRGGRQIDVRARHVVIAAGCVESVRLMLLAAREAPELYGGVESWLGRGFMQHVRTRAATVHATPGQARQLQSLLNRFHRADRPFEEIGFAARAEWRDAQRLGNLAAVLRYSRARRRALVPSPSAMIRWARGQVPILTAPEIELQVDAEQACDRGSRILLDDRRDAAGVPLAAIDWRIGEIEARGTAAMATAIGGWLEARGLGVLEIDPDVARGALPRDRLLDSLHHLGGTRMSDTPSLGVVDPALRVHGVPNLSICGGSVFATGGHANPTLTIVALALRLADRLAL